MVMKTYSYHVYQPKAKSKQGRFVDINTKSIDANGRVRKQSTSKESRHPLIVTSEQGPQLCDNPQLTPQLFAATQQAILKSQQQQHAAAQGGAAPANFTTSQYTFQTFKMKGRANQQPAKRLSAGSASASNVQTAAASPLPSNPSYYGQAPLAIRPMIVPDMSMMPHNYHDALPPLAPYPGLSKPVAASDPINILGAADAATTATLPSTPQLSGAATPVPHYISPAHTPPATVTLAEAATPPMPSALPPLVDNMIMASLDNTNFTHLSEQQQLELMNAAVTQFAGLCSENLIGLNVLTAGHPSPGADSTLAMQSVDTLSQGWDDCGPFSEEHSSPGGLSLLDDNFILAFNIVIK